uniref:CA domain-containing protein n=1 Tax=Hymenolepis diminuta TaxID=6216 RepID=A0A0R3SVH4_HYMDI
LDREAIERITLIVLVTDALTQPIFTSTATVSIEVLDENDNSPVFVNPPANMQSGDLAHAFTVRENSPKYTRLSGRLEARDPDAGENGRLLFYIRSVWALKTPASQRGISFGGNMIDNSAPGRQLIDPVKIFQITPDGGIETLVEFDREQVAMYLLSVGVRDNGSKPYSTYASVLVQILDENDNSPVWSFPTETARQINITTANPPGSLVARLQVGFRDFAIVTASFFLSDRKPQLLGLGNINASVSSAGAYFEVRYVEKITQLKAHDADADGAGRVEFQILDSNGQSMPPVSISRGLYNAPPPQPSSQSKHPSPILQEELMGYRVGPFYLNGSTGELLVADRLVPLNLKIRLRAIDCGDAQRLFTDTWMIINVKMDPNEFGGFLGGGRAGALNVTIILVMIAVTAIISLLLIIAIVCVRRKPSRTVMGNGTAVVESEGRMVAYSPGSPFMIPDPNKETLSANTWNGSSKDFYPPGSLTIDENGQVVSTGGMAYGSPILGSDKTSIFCGGVPQQYTSLEANGDIISGSLPMHTFGTMSRNPRQTAVLGSIHGSTTGMRMAGSLQYDADSGDSGRGPSEDGNQLMLMDNQRMFSPHPGHAYGTCSGYRSASRMSYGPRSASAMGNPSNGCIVNPNNGMMNASSRTFIHDPHNNGDPCSCYVEEGQQQGHLQQPRSPPYGEYIDTPGSPFLAQRSPLGGYRTFHFSPSPQRFTPGAGESTISASIGSLPRSRAPSRSTVTFQSPSLVHQQPQQQPIKLDLRGPVELDNSEATFPGLPPRPTTRTVSNLDDNEDIVD